MASPSYSISRVMEPVRRPNDDTREEIGGCSGPDETSARTGPGPVNRVLLRPFIGSRLGKRLVRGEAHRGATIRRSVRSYFNIFTDSYKIPKVSTVWQEQVRIKVILR